jgi:hypothetical protein
MGWNGEGRRGGSEAFTTVQTKTHVKSILFLLSTTSLPLVSISLIICACRFSVHMLQISCIYAYIGLGCMRYVFVFILSRMVFVPCRSPSAGNEFPLTPQSCLGTLERILLGVSRVMESMLRRRYLGLCSS